MARPWAVPALAVLVGGLGGAWLAVNGGGEQAEMAAAAAPAAATLAPAVAAFPPSGAAPAGPLVLAGQSAAQAADPAEQLRLAGFDTEWLASRGFSTPEALRKLAVLLDAGHELKGAAGQRLAIRPSGAGGADAAERARLAPQEGYVTAALTEPLSGQQDAVLVRWRRDGDAGVMELTQHAVPARPGEPPSIWMHRPQGWEPGSYHLEVISADPRLEVLAAAQFDIVGPGERVDPFMYEAQVRAQVRR